MAVSLISNMETSENGTQDAATASDHLLPVVYHQTETQLARRTTKLNSAVTQRPQRSAHTLTRPDYKPLSHRWPFLTVLVIVICALIGFLELAVRTLPSKEEDFHILQRSLGVVKRLTTTGEALSIPATASSVDGDDEAECTVTITPVRIFTVTRTEPTATSTSTLFETEVTTYTLETTVTVSSTLKADGAIITAPPKLARRQCTTVTAPETLTFTTDGSAYIEIGTVTIINTRTVVIAKTETAVVTPSGIVPTTPTFTPSPASKSTQTNADFDTTKTGVDQVSKSGNISSSKDPVEPSTKTIPGGQATSTLSPPGTSAGPAGSAVAVTSATQTRRESSSKAATRTDEKASVSANVGTIQTSSVATTLLEQDLESAISATRLATTADSMQPLRIFTSVEFDSLGVPTATYTQEALLLNIPTTLLNDQGQPTATMAYTGWILAKTSILTDSHGMPTETVVSSILLSPYTTVLTDSFGNPTATQMLSSTIPFATHTIESSDTVQSTGGDSLVTILSDAHGNPTRTTTLSPKPLSTTVILTNSDGRPTLTLTLSAKPPTLTTTLTDSDGHPTSTLAYAPGPFPLVTTLTDSNGRPTSTITILSANSRLGTTLTDSDGLPTATTTVPTPETTTIIQTSTSVYVTSSYQYLTGMFLGTLLATLLAIPTRLIDIDARRMEPFNAMTLPEGTSAAKSLLLKTGGIRSSIARVLSLTSLLTTCSALLTPLAAETISLALHGDCYEGRTTGKNCATSLTVATKPARAVEAILIVMAILTLALLVRLRQKRSGVETDPWSMGGLAKLLTHPRTHGLLTSISSENGEDLALKFKKTFGGDRFRLGYFDNRDSRTYGIVALRFVLSSSAHSLVSNNASTPPLSRTTTDSAPSAVLRRQQAARHKQQISALSRLGLALHLMFLLGLLILIVTYNNTGGPTGFEKFMDSETFGVRFLFALFGVVATYLFSGVFDGICVLMPYKLLSHQQSAKLSARIFYTSPPTNGLTALWTAAKVRSIFLGSAAFLNFLAVFLPVLLANVPYRTTQTRMTHTVCTWLCVGVICLLILMVLYLLCFVSWPHLPADVRTVAGAAWYIAETDSDFSHVGPAVKRPEDGSDLNSPMLPKGRILGEGSYMFGCYTDDQGNDRMGVRWIQAGGPSNV